MTDANDFLSKIRRDRQERLLRSVHEYDERFGVASTAGPTCPYCGDTITPDEGFYYDENRYAEGECGACGEKFRVEVFTQTTWTTFRKLDDEGE